MYDNRVAFCPKIHGLRDNRGKSHKFIEWKDPGSRHPEELQAVLSPSRIPLTANPSKEESHAFYENAQGEILRGVYSERAERDSSRSLS